MGCGSTKNSVAVVPPSRSGSFYSRGSHILKTDRNKANSSLTIKSENLSIKETFNFEDYLTTDAISYEVASKLQPKDIKEMWSIVKKTSDKQAINVVPLKNRKGWRTIRIFVSSTFKDFHQEREVLVKEVCYIFCHFCLIVNIHHV